MNRLKLSKEVLALGLPLTALEKLELVEFMMDSFEKATDSGPRFLAMPSHFDTVSEMSFEGRRLTRGMSTLFMEDVSTNPRDLTNYYANI
jgi:hypothetical protein